MMRVCVEAVGLAAPGLPGWSESRPILAGSAPWTASELPVYQPRLLPPNERRRATLAVRQAFQAAEDAMSHSQLEASSLATVFASSDADMGVLHRICNVLAQPTPQVSPTDFHNSVHNAASGYWSIAAKSTKSSTTIAAHDASFAAGLVSAVTMVVAEGASVLLVCYDVPAPEPLHSARTIRWGAGVAMVLTGKPTGNTVAELGIAPSAAAESHASSASLEELRVGNPALRAIPALERIARGLSGTVHLPYTGNSTLAVDVS